MIDTSINEGLSSPDLNEKPVKKASLHDESEKTETPIKKSKYRPSYFTPKIKFSPEEDLLLIDAVKILGTNAWHDIAKKVPGRNARQCRERWNNYLNPSLISTPWSPEEDIFLLQKRQDLGLHWQNIATFFPTRSKNSIKNRYSILMRRQNKKNRKSKNKSNSDDKDNPQQSTPSESLQSCSKSLFAESKEFSTSTKIPAIFNLDDEILQYDEFVFLNDQKTCHQNQQVITLTESDNEKAFNMMCFNLFNTHP